MREPTLRLIVRHMRQASGLEIFLGALVALVPLFVRVEFAGLINGLLVGGFVLGVAAWDAWAEGHGRADTVAEPTWMLLLAGLWLSIYPFFLVAGPAYLWTTFGAGLLLMASSVYVIAQATRLRLDGRPT